MKKARLMVMAALMLILLLGVLPVAASAAALDDSDIANIPVAQVRDPDSYEGKFKSAFMDAQSYLENLYFHGKNPTAVKTIQAQQAQTWVLGQRTYEDVKIENSFLQELVKNGQSFVFNNTAGYIRFPDSFLKEAAEKGWSVNILIKANKNGDVTYSFDVFDQDGNPVEVTIEVTFGRPRRDTNMTADLSSLYEIDAQNDAFEHTASLESGDPFVWEISPQGAKTATMEDVKKLLSMFCVTVPGKDGASAKEYPFNKLIPSGETLTIGTLNTLLQDMGLSEAEAARLLKKYFGPHWKNSTEELDLGGVANVIASAANAIVKGRYGSGSLTPAATGATSQEDRRYKEFFHTGKGKLPENIEFEEEIDTSDMTFDNVYTDHF